MAVATARVAGLASTASKAASTTSGTTVGITETSLGAVASNVAHLTALVALGRRAISATHGAVARDVAGLSALVARLVVLHGLGAVTACIWSASTIHRVSCLMSKKTTYSCDPRL